MQIGLSLTLKTPRQSGAISIDASVFDGGTITLYSGADADDAGDPLGSGTLPSKAFENVDGDGIRAKHGIWSATLTKNCTAIRGALISSADESINVWCEVVTGAPVGNQIQIDHADGQIGDVVTLTTLNWDLVSDGNVDSIVSFSRDLGSVAGLVTMTATVTGATGDPLVLVDTTPATNVVVVGPTEITFTMPAHAAGMVDITIGDQTFVNAYRYCAAATQGFQESFDTAVNGGVGSNMNKETNGAGAAVTQVNSAGIGPGGRDYLMRCSVPVGATEARVNPAIGTTGVMNLPLQGNDGQWWGTTMKSTDAVMADFGTQIKSFIARTHGGTALWPNIGFGSDFGSPGGGSAWRKKNDPSSSPVTPDGITLTLDGTPVTLGDDEGWVRLDVNYKRVGGVGTYYFYVNLKLVASQSDASLGDNNTSNPNDQVRPRPGVAFVNAAGRATTAVIDLGWFYDGDGFREMAA